MKDERKDIEAIDDIRLLVDTFYEKVRDDEMLGPIFQNVIRDNWPEHLDKMYRFWQTVLLGEHTYSGSPFPPHGKLPIDENHFQRWLELFSVTLNELFSGDKADEALWRAQKMAEMFRHKIEFFRNHPTQKNI